jgi:hypothetical protein
MYAAESGYHIINEIGVPAIREKSVRQTQRLIELAEAAGFASPARGIRRSAAAPLRSGTTAPQRLPKS